MRRRSGRQILALKMPRYFQQPALSGLQGALGTELLAAETADTFLGVDGQSVVVYSHGVWWAKLNADTATGADLVPGLWSGGQGLLEQMFEKDRH